jgi:DNA-binding beta-propeller fold protein YncE
MNRRLKISWLLALPAALVLASCTSTPPVAPNPTSSPALVWPPAPDEPRIAFMRTLHGPHDIGQTASMLRTFANWITGDKGENLNLHKPFAVALDETGNLCVADTDDKLVCFADFAHKKWRRFEGVGKIEFASPVAVARRNGIFYVADSQLAKVFAFNENGRAVFEISAPLKRPVGLALAGDSLYVVDSQAHAVFVFGLDGTLESSFGQRGTGTGEFNFPTAIAADGRGHIVVSDTMNCRVEIFDERGNFISQFGSNGDTSGHFARPKCVALDSAGHIYVVDAVFDNFQIFDLTGQLLLNVGESGSGNGQFGLPNGIAIGADNQIFVADAFNHRVQVFKYLGQP